MRIFVAGASGVLGLQLLPLLIADGHDVAAMTRSAEKVDALARTGADPVVCDVFDQARLHDVIAAFGPTVVIHELTDLPDELAKIPEYGAAHSRIRREGTDNLLRAARAANAEKVIAQSIAWEVAGSGGEAVAHLEHAVLSNAGVVLRYGQWYGPGTYYAADDPPSHPRIHIDVAAARTAAMLDAAPGVYTIAEATESEDAA